MEFRKKNIVELFMMLQDQNLRIFFFKSLYYFLYKYATQGIGQIYNIGTCLSVHAWNMTITYTHQYVYFMTNLIDFCSLNFVSIPKKNNNNILIVQTNIF